ncbi:MAG TPA: hypothetical protein VI612_00260 [Candidatus Nanoarchaeia archaeon]|nr:hypothetical protein [Candidatus Nanoarchaeia archaeon]
MELEEISRILKTHNHIVFGPKESPKSAGGDYPGLPYIAVDVKEKTIMFTSDTIDYTMPKQLEEAMEKLFSKFGVINYKIQFHIQKGGWHDKDIILQLQNIEGVQNPGEMPEIIKFIQDSFYKVDDWNFKSAGQSGFK